MTRGAVVNNPLGVSPGPPDKAWVYNRTGAARAIGDVVMLDIAQTATETTGTGFNDAAGIWANVVLPATAGLPHGIFAVVSGLLSGAGADNALMEVTFISPKIGVNVVGTDAAAAYEALSPRNGADTLNSDANSASEKLVGIALGASAGSSEELIDVMFNGWHPFGV